VCMAWAVLSVFPHSRDHAHRGFRFLGHAKLYRDALTAQVYRRGLALGLYSR